ncbi:hypothetical protein HK16_03050 [Acetobacter senegalensis]|uniref:Uncharacterized protein n=1 Tax=Acetobacter senegalensis TaxID=446692 RepID=A0A252EDV6_9PROT|nr:hypothetical protein HK16_03050 [Acetobacter senegalensis]
MSCGIESPKQLFRVERRWKGPMLPNGLQILGGDGLPSTAHFRTSPTDRGGSNSADASAQIIVGEIDTGCRRPPFLDMSRGMAGGTGLSRKDSHAGQSRSNYDRRKMDGKG